MLLSRGDSRKQRTENSSTIRILIVGLDMLFILFITSVLLLKCGRVE